MRIDVPGPFGPAFALLETRSIARGIVVCDAMVKRAPVRFLLTTSVSPGKYLIVIDGGEAEVEEAFGAGLAIAGDSAVDRLILPRPHAGVWQALTTALDPGPLDAVGVVECLSVSATIRALDAALNAAEVRVVQWELARGIGGKGWFALTGSLDQLEAAVEAASRSLGDGLLVGLEVLPRPHEELLLGPLVGTPG